MTSTTTYSLLEGLQQGAVNSPVFFNIHSSRILNLYDMNSKTNTYTAAVADDVIVYVAGNKVDLIRAKLEDLVNKINKHYRLWNLGLNPAKSETILFHKPAQQLSKVNRIAYRAFKIKIADPNTMEEVDIPHKKTVKYLGVNLDYLMRLNEHVTTQLKKARNIFHAHGYLFHNKYLSRKAKIICYLLLVRPVITYAAPIWWNISHTLME